MESPRRRVAVVGGGYVGLVPAVGLARFGHNLDIRGDEGRRRRLLDPQPLRATGLQYKAVGSAPEAPASSALAAVAEVAVTPG